MDAPRFDAARGIYLLDMVYTRPEAIGTLQISVISPEGVEALRVSVPRSGRNQSIEVNASALQAGLAYKVEVKAFDPAGAPILNTNGDALLAEREFTHLPGQARLGDPRFVIDAGRAQVRIEVDLTSSQAVSGYRVVLENADTKAVALDTQLPGPPPLTVALQNVPAGKYQATIIALDAAGQPLAQAQDEFVYQTGATTLGDPLFEYRADPPALLVRLQPANALPVAKYLISLINKDSNQVALDYAASASSAGAGDGAATIAVPVKNLAAGSYRVLVRAVDASGQELAAVDGETAYTPPAPPGLAQRVLGGLAANPLIPILIVVVLLAAIGGVVVYTRWERSATATPMLQGWKAAAPPAPPGTAARPGGSYAGGAQATPLPLNRTMLQDPNATPIIPQPGGAPPELVLTVTASPDKRLAGKRIPVSRFPFTMGRSDCDLSVSGDQHISRRHAELHFDGRGLVLVDRLSSNGTFLNGERLAADQPAPIPLGKPARIQLGRETRLTLTMADRKAGRKN